MNNKFFSALAISILFLASCQKDDAPAPAPVAVKFMSTTSGSIWNYEIIDNVAVTTAPYTLASTSKDSTINARSYHVYSHAGSANEYYNITGSDYYNFRSLPAGFGGTNVEYLYLKDNAAVGTTWSQTYPVTASGIPLNAILTNTITEKGVTKVVKGISYADVIHITTTVAVTVSGVPLPTSAITTNIHSYYAGKVGLIQSVNKINISYGGITDNTDQQTNLNTSVIK